MCFCVPLAYGWRVRLIYMTFWTTYVSQVPFFFQFPYVLDASALRVYYFQYPNCMCLPTHPIQIEHCVGAWRLIRLFVWSGICFSTLFWTMFHFSFSDTNEFASGMWLVFSLYLIGNFCLISQFQHVIRAWDFSHTFLSSQTRMLI